MENSNNTTPKKENRILVALMSCIMAAFLFGCGGETEITSAANTEEVKQEVPVIEEEPEELPAEESEEKEEESPPTRIYAQVGTTDGFTYGDNVGEVYITIENIGVEYANGTEFFDACYVVYADIEIENETSGTVATNTVSDVDIYIDDYQYNTFDSENIVQMNNSGFDQHSMSINKYRKGKMRMFAGIDTESADNASNIEMELFGSMDILIKEGGKWLYGDQASSGSTSNNSEELGGVVYGVYIMSNNTYGGKSEVEIGFYTDEDYPGDYIYINLYDGEGNLCSDYNGYSPEGGNPATFYDKYETGFRVTYTSDGIEVKGLEGSEYEEEFNGFYQLDHAFNLDEVG